jgi:uncharacterized protein YbjT (DUF2867 family)
MVNVARVLVAGASRGVGLAVVQQLRAQGREVVGLLRSPQAQAELEGLGAEVVLGDALDAAAMEQAVAQSRVDAVISTVGGVSEQGDRSDYVGNRNLIDAALKAGAKRFILVSSIGSGDSVGALSAQVLAALKPALLEKEKAEAHLAQSGLGYTVVRPGGLKSEPATGSAVLTRDVRVSGMIHRADVAALVCQCLESELALGQVLSAIDPNQRFVEFEFEPFVV